MSFGRLHKVAQEGGGAHELMKAAAARYLGLGEHNRMVVSKSFVESIEAAQEELQNLQGLSDEQKKAKCDDWNATITQICTGGKSAAEVAQHNKELDAAIAKVEAWEPPELLDEELYGELIDIKSDTILFLQNLKLVSSVEEGGMTLKSVDKWYADVIRDATASIQQAIARYENELEKVNKANRTLATLDECFEETNDGQ